MKGNARFVDSNVFIYVILNDPSHARTALLILKRIEAGEEAYTSTLALSQVFAHLKKRKKWNAIDAFYDYLKGSPLTIIDTKIEDFVKAQELRDSYGLQWEMWDDLVMASQMERVGSSEIYSNDTDYDRIGRIKRIFR